MRLSVRASFQRTRARTARTARQPRRIEKTERFTSRPQNRIIAKPWDKLQCSHMLLYFIFFALAAAGPMPFPALPYSALLPRLPTLQVLPLDLSLPRTVHASYSCHRTHQK